MLIRSLPVGFEKTNNRFGKLHPKNLGVRKDSAKSQPQFFVSRPNVATKMKKKERHGFGRMHHYMKLF